MKPRIGTVGLGSIAQKAYLPILTQSTNWNYIGAFTPNAAKRKQICEQYRIQDFHSLQALMAECDAVFVHSTTDTHEEIVAELLSHGKDVYVDKPLAYTLEGAERLALLSEKHNRKLMVGFNRRFAPMYVEAKAAVTDLAWVRFEKHRHQGIGPYSTEFTMLDDYLHVMDTVRWLSETDLSLVGGELRVTDQDEMKYAQHFFKNKSDVIFTTAMHRHAGTGLEQLELADYSKMIRVKNMNTKEVEENMQLTSMVSGSWDTILKQRGFEGAIHHFIDCVSGDFKPSVDGFEALKSQQLVMELINK